MPSQVELSITVPGADPDDIRAISEELATWIDEAAPDCDAELLTKPGAPVNKGLLEVLGKIGVTILDHGAIASLAKCLAVFIKERRRDISITLKVPSGASVQIKAGGIGAKELDDIVLRLGAMVAPEAKAGT